MVKNYIVIYRVNEAERQVIIVTVRYALRNLEGKYPLRLFLLRTTSYDFPPLCGFGDFLLSRVSAGKGNGGIFKGADLILILD